MNATQMADALHERANHLYWNSPDTVDQIAAELGMSRNALYSAVQPEPVGMDCPGCGEDLVHPNRSSRSAGRAVCLACDRTVAVADLPSPRVRTVPEARSGYLGRALGYAGNGRRIGGLRDGLAAVEPERAAMIGGAAVLGAVAGVAVASLFRQLS